MCIEIPAKETLNKSQAELFDNPVWWMELLGPTGQLTYDSDQGSKVAVPFEVVPHSCHFPPSRALIVIFGLWVWLTEGGVPVEDFRRVLGIYIR